MALLISIFLVPDSCFSFEPVLKAGIKLQASGSDLDAGTYAIPRVYDWNNDGKKDLIIGEHNIYGSGKVRLYLNFGTDAEPVFASDEDYIHYYDPVAGDYVPVSVSGSGCQGAAPEVVDWDNDGMKDLLVGDAYGYTTLFINQNDVSDENPDLLDEGFVQVGGSNYTVMSRAVPCINDWNEDSKKDLLIGRGDGQISLLFNTNTDDDPVFDVDDRVYADLAPLDGGYRVAPRIFDWDGDGYKDIIAGEGYGRILFYKNIRTNDDPDFDDEKVYLAADGSQINLENSRTRPEIVDWNNDGLPDILCGTLNGFVYYFEQEFIFEFESISYDSSTGTTLVWRSRIGDTYTVYYSTNLADWYALDNSVASGGYTTEWTDSGSTTIEKRSYKVQVNE